MRRILAACALVVVAVPAFAQDPPAPAGPAQPEKAVEPAERKFAEGKLFDPYWSLTYELAGLTESPAAGGGQGKIFEGKAGDLTVEILVQEGDKPRTSAEWRAEAKKAWAEKKRDMKDAASGDDPAPWETFVEKSLAGFERHHGYSFQARGLQVFVVHARADAKTETSGAAIAKALGGLKLGEDRGASAAAQMIARSAGKPADSVQVLIGAGQMYLAPKDRRGLDNSAMAERVLEQALRAAKEGEIEADTRHAVDEMLGLATMNQNKLDAAVGWFTKAIESAGKVSENQDHAVAGSTYNLACAYSRGGKLDAAFAALEKSFAKDAEVVPLDHLKTDTDLDNLHKDPRWEPLVKKVEGGGVK